MAENAYELALSPADQCYVLPPAMSFAENYVGLPYAIELDRIAPRRVAELR